MNKAARAPCAPDAVVDQGRRRFFLLGATAAAAACAPGIAWTAPRPVTVVRHICPEGRFDLRNRYFLDLLALALRKTERSDGPFRLECAPAPLLQNDAFTSLATGKTIDVLWSMTTIAREKIARPVRIPLLKGLMGHRICIVRRDSLDAFADVRTLADLRRHTAVQGNDWPDADILAANGLRVVRGHGYDALFGMLLLRQADYFPRAFNEPWDEVAVRGRRELVVEPTLLLRYTTDNYFFVSPHNPALADRIERGLRAALADGSFEWLFRKHPINKEAFASARLSRRRIIDLHNPLLPPETPLGEAALWYRLPRD